MNYKLDSFVIKIRTDEAGLTKISRKTRSVSLPDRWPIKCCAFGVERERPKKITVCFIYAAEHWHIADQCTAGLHAWLTAL